MIIPTGAYSNHLVIHAVCDQSSLVLEKHEKNQHFDPPYILQMERGKTNLWEYYRQGFFLRNSMEKTHTNKGNAKRGVSPRLKIWPGDLDLWPWKSIGFQILLRTKYVPSLVKIYWRMLILECSQGCLHGKNLTQWPWPLTYDTGLTLEGNSGKEVALWLLTSLCSSAKREVEVAL